MRKLLFISGILLFILQSCATTKKTVPATGEIADQSLNTFKTAYLASLPAFEHLQIRSKLDADIDDKSNTATLRLYFDRDDLIWANVSLLGITGARANITPDKVQAYEVLDKTFIDSDFTFFNEKLKVNFINFERLNQLLLGQLFLIEPWTSYTLDTSDPNRYALKYKLNDELTKNPQEGKYIHTFYLDSNYRLSQVSIFDKSSNTSITVNYDSWQLLNGKNYPGKVKILIKGKEEDRIDLEYNNFDFSSMNPPFKIPENYTPRKIN